MVRGVLAYEPELVSIALKGVVAELPGGEADYLDALRAYLDVINGRLLARSGKRVFVEKTPRYALYGEFLRKLYPDLQVVAYVNTTAAVKAVVDVCCTSANAVKIVEQLPTEHILFVPDEHLGNYVQSQTKKMVISWNGNCYVHHQITPENILAVKETLPEVQVLVHPECRADVVALADAVLSTSGMVRYAKESPAKEFLIVTECGLSDKLLLEVPEKTFYKACKLCQFMKMITLDGTLRSLETMTHRIELDETVRVNAERSLRRMLELS